MMQRAPLLLVAAGMAILGARAQAAESGIDCAKADLPDEKAICADQALMGEDARMTALYAAAMSRSGMGERGDLQDGQTAWLEQRHACKADAACVADTYKARIGKLKAVIDAASGRDPL